MRAYRFDDQGIQAGAESEIGVHRMDCELSGRRQSRRSAWIAMAVQILLITAPGIDRVSCAGNVPKAARAQSQTQAARSLISRQVSATGSESAAANQSVLELEVGHAHVLKVPGARQVAVGNSQTLQATAHNSNEVILFGKRAGTTSVDVWSQKGARQSFRVVVHAADRSLVLDEIQSLLKDVGTVRVLTAGSHILLQAESLTSSQRQIVDRILARFPDVVDMTASMSWDPMVMLDVMVIEMPTYKLSELGVRWQTAQGSGGIAGLAWQTGQASAFGQSAMQQFGLVSTGSEVNKGGIGNSGNVGNAPGRIASWLGLNTVLHSELQAMADRGEALLLAQPQLMTRSGKTASFLAGGEVPYALTDDKGRTHTEFKKYGVSLSVTPELGEQGRIVASVEVEVSAVDSSIITPAGPAMRVRKANTQFNAYSGQTMVLAGFMSSDRSSNYRGAPSPEGSFLERLTGVQDERSRQTELAILVTPVITQADDPSMRDRVRRAQTFAQVESEPSRRLLEPIAANQDVTRADWIGEHSDEILAGPAGQDQWGAHANQSSPWEQFKPSMRSDQWADQDVTRTMHDSDGPGETP
ncbi:type II and III secretion system protein family protein [Orrella marina]|uniref:Uncharacterized protein n=1 Tax=Orrella marina TaxID=2163011 RepID=A0A2R4XIB8_9BURK|nr:pilus assembly protein N-terminal domain-containing protein [Orrella marina]AWB33469.1 hypothetical protein DBV39_06835 [Orrella marina]